MIVSRCFDASVLKKIMKHPSVYRWIVDDGCPPIESFEPAINDHVYYVLVSNPEPIAVFMYHPHNAITFEVHTCVLPVAYGERAQEAAKKSLRWMIDNTSAQKIITNVPANNIKAKRFAIRCGMSLEGINRESFLLGGVVYDQYMLGITKGEICQQQQR